MQLKSWQCDVWTNFKTNKDNGRNYLATEVIEKNKNVDDPCHRTSWELLSAHREIYSILARGIIAQLGGDTEALEKHRLESVARAWELEEITQHAFDTMFYQSGTRYRINLNKAIAFFDF